MSHPASSSVLDRKNIIITGGAGFIGSHLCERLIAENNIICIDNFISGNQDNIAHLLTNPNFEFINHDISQPIDLESFPELERFNIRSLSVQQIYNLACPTSPKEFEKYKQETLDANSLGVKNMLDLAVQYRTQFLQASSSVIYGPRDMRQDYFNEKHEGKVLTISPRACYDEGKRFAETSVATYQQTKNLDAKIARIFRTYGPRMRLFDGQMIPDFIVAALDNKDLVIYGDESFRTSLVYVDDVVDALIRLMSSDLAEPVNIGGIDDYNITDVAKKIIELTDSKSRIEYQDSLLFMTDLGLPDISLAKERLQWVPITRLEEGLQKAIDYAKANKSVIQKQYKGGV